jgi:Zn-dependent protease with chaperone function
MPKTLQARTLASSRAATLNRLLLWAELFYLILCATGALAQSSRTSPDAISHSQHKEVTQYTLPPEKLARAHALYVIENWLFVVSSLYSLAVMLLFLQRRWAAKLRDFAERVSTRRSVQTSIVASFFIVTLSVLLLPPAIYAHHVARKYGLSVQGWASWFRDWAVQLALLVVLGTLVIWILYAIIRRSPRRWWLYFWLACVPIAAFVTFLAPVVIDPLFNKFQPLEQSHPELVTELEKVTQRAGLNIPRSRMYEMIASTKVTGSNAYVTGFGPSKRVVVWDTAIKNSSTPELMFTFAHELGHYVLHHVVKGFLFGAALFLLLFYIGYRLVNWATAKWGRHWGIRAVDDLASLPLMVLVLSVLTFFAAPALNAYSRHIEHQADAYALRVTQAIIPDASQVAARSFQNMGEEWLDYPFVGRLAEFWRWDHPTTAERVRFAAEYHP